ncbi:MAG: ribosomal RNA small subunit methyltransferase A [Firmicutes bacterium]|nr:ribosomal RNA small subunit methyltransferase A [Bacillota bacterium]
MDEAPSALTSPSRLRPLLQRYGLTPKRRFSQNFLIDRRVRDAIVAKALPQPTDVLEIGPGVGTLTEALAGRAHHVRAIEIDERLLPALAETVGTLPNVEVIHGDVLALPAQQLFAGLQQPAVVGNLPYGITAPLLLRLVQWAPCFDHAVIMVQREVAERLVATPKRKAYGRLSVLIQLHMQVEWVLTVPKGAFYPAPQVASAVLVLYPQDPWRFGVDPQRIEWLAKVAFGQRRKMLRHNLAAAFAGTTETLGDLFAACGIDLNARGEDLDLETLARLAARLDRAAQNV